METKFKTAIGSDPLRFINVYTCSGSGYLGWSSLPQHSAEDSLKHGVVVAHEALTGGNFPGKPPRQPGVLLQ